MIKNLFVAGIIISFSGLALAKSDPCGYVPCEKDAVVKDSKPVEIKSEDPADFKPKGMGFPNPHLNPVLGNDKPEK